MLRPRIIPCLLVRNRGLVKTVNFSAPTYVGDPLNTVKLFNEKEVDEIVVLDIDATSRETEPDYEMIRSLAAECRMPLCYGGGVRAVEQAVRIIKMGVEKVAMSAAAIENPDLVTALAKEVGSQSVVVVLDVRRNPKTRAVTVWTHNGSRNTGKDPKHLAQEFQARGVGEIVVNSIDHDGAMKGYDLELIRHVRDGLSVPMTVLGGAGSLSDIELLIRTFGVIGAAAGSLFVFKGTYRAVLINYPRREARVDLYAGGFAGGRLT